MGLSKDAVFEGDLHGFGIQTQQNEGKIKLFLMIATTEVKDLEYPVDYHYYFAAIFEFVEPTVA